MNMPPPPFLSVILPTYNRKYCVSRMIDSVLQQSFEDFELIIVDDGSTDDTFEMLEEKYQDKRIRLTKQENGGVSSARNLGISLAKGNYITFVDSDDYLLDGFFEDIYKNLKESQYEVLVYGGYILKDDRQMEAPLFWFDKEYGQNGVMVNDSEEFVKDFCLLGGNSWGCAKVFKRSLILDNKVLFDTRITFGEDMLFNLQTYLSSSQILTSPKKFYICDNNTESLSRGMLTLKERCKNLLLAYKILEKYEDYRTYFAFNTLCHMKKWLWYVYFCLDKEIREQIKMIIALASLHERGQLQRLEFKLIKKSIPIGSMVFYLYFLAHSLYLRMTYIHPITTPIIQRFKKRAHKEGDSKV